MRLKALDAMGTTTNPQPFIESVQGRFSSPVNLSCEVRFPSVKRYFKICFPEIAENPQGILGKSFKELKTYGLHTLQDLKKLCPNVESIFTPKEQQELVDVIQAHIRDVSRRALTGPFRSLPQELIQLIILFSGNPWQLFRVSKYLEIVTKDPQVAHLFLTELSNRWGMTKEALFEILKVQVPSELAKEYLKHFYTKQRALAKDPGLPTRGVSLLSLQKLIEGILKYQKGKHLIAIIQQNDPVTILSVLNSSLDACDNLDTIEQALAVCKNPVLSEIGLQKLANEVTKRVAERERCVFNTDMREASIEYADSAEMKWEGTELSLSQEGDFIRFALEDANRIDLRVSNGKKEKRKAISYIIKILRKMGEFEKAKKLQTEMDQELGNPEQYIASIKINFLT